MSYGVPQGSVIGPLLWNIMYDKVLRTELREGSEILGFANDTMVIASGDSADNLEAWQMMRYSESLKLYIH